MNGATIEAFQSFVANARALVCECTGPGKEPPGDHGIVSDQEPTGVRQFRNFVTDAKPLATDFARRYLEWFEPHARRIRKLPPMPDLIDIAGYTRVENSYTRLVAWALGKEHPSSIRGGTLQQALAMSVQRCWLGILNLESATDPQLQVEDQVILDSGGILDLLLAGESSFVAVEVKTKSREHDAAESQEKQTVHYPKEIHKGRYKNRDVQGHMVFLTEDGDTPENKDAIAATFTALALAILDAIEETGASEADAWPYYVLASHWIDKATPGLQLREFVTKYSADTSDDRQLIDTLPQVNQLATLVPMSL